MPTECGAKARERERAAHNPTIAAKICQKYAKTSKDVLCEMRKDFSFQAIVFSLYRFMCNSHFPIDIQAFSLLDFVAFVLILYFIIFSILHIVTRLFLHRCKKREGGW